MFIVTPSSDLRSRVAIEKPIETTDSDNQEIITWKRLAYRQVKVIHKGGTESVINNRTVSRSMYKVTFKGDDLSRILTTEHRLILRKLNRPDRILSITNINDIEERGIEIVCDCIELTA